MNYRHAKRELHCMDKITIAICEDFLIFAENLRQVVYDICEEQHFSADIEVFQSGEALIKELDAGKYYDIVFLDIEMPEGISGIHVGHLIKGMYKQDEVIIFMISSFDMYYDELFDLRPFNFIKKREENFNEYVKSKFLPALGRIKRYADSYTFSYNRNTYSIRKMKIMYLESKGRYIDVNYVKNMHLGTFNTISFRGALRDEFLKFPDDCFITPHASFIANLYHVISFRQRHLLMRNRKEIPISYTRAKEADRAIKRFESDIDERDNPLGY